MKKLILVSTMLALASNLALADTQTLRCQPPGEHSHKFFTATLDFSSFDSGSGLFRVAKASIVDNYASARLTCAGYRLKDVECVGFWFEQTGRIADVRIAKTEDGYAAYYRTLTGDRPIGGGPLPCSVE
ncbi:MAG: hypothetical protein HY075_04730 [Deltaproteobacteria bacterium]|nr:hypothetical protein [Deltaproteobacteria bacterium]